jgi:purine-cytosine permease-like protein
MHSEILFIMVLIAPWVLVLMAMYFYKRRRIRKAELSASSGGRDDRPGGAGQAQCR